MRYDSGFAVVGFGMWVGIRANKIYHKSYFSIAIPTIPFSAKNKIFCNLKKLAHPISQAPPLMEQFGPLPCTSSAQEVSQKLHPARVQFLRYLSSRGCTGKGSI